MRGRMSSGGADAASHDHRAATLLLALGGGSGQFATPCASGNGPHLGLCLPPGRRARA